jgi:Mrp family chromosome partitioning ATPase
MENSNQEGDGEGRSPQDRPYAFSTDVVMLPEPRGRRAEGIRVLRTHILAQHVDDGRRGLAICAASPGVGATFTAVNLAVSLSQVGLSVLLIDADMRGSQLGHFIRGPSSPGLKQFLEEDDMASSSVIRRDVIPGLSILFSGGNASGAQELLAGERFSQLLKGCLRDFDITIVDTPPANICADGRRISSLVGYSLIVAKRDVSYVNDIKHLAMQLHGDKALVVGSVLSEA